MTLRREDRAVEIMNRALQPAQGTRARADAAANISRKGEDMETIERSIDLTVPVDTAYQQWTRFEEFPQVMEGVEARDRASAGPRMTAPTAERTQPRTTGLSAAEGRGRGALVPRSAPSTQDTLEPSL